MPTASSCRCLLQGAQNKSFDSIAFYGAGLNTLSTDTHVYWLTAGNSPGLRIQTDPLRVSREVRPPASPTPSPEAIRSIYAAGLLIGDNADNFFGPVIGSDPVGQSLTVHHSVSGGITPTLQVSVQGLTRWAHTVSVQFNGLNLGIVSLADQNQGLGSFPLESRRAQRRQQHHPSGFHGRQWGHESGRYRQPHLRAQLRHGWFHAALHRPSGPRHHHLHFRPKCSSSISPTRPMCI